MALEKVPVNTIKGKAIRELQNLNQLIVNSAAANSDIAVTGIETDDTIVSVQNLTDLATVTGCSITSAGNIRSANSVAAKKYLVSWFKKPHPGT